MAKKLYEESNIQDIADVIRKKNGETTKYKTSEMAEAINQITINKQVIPDEAFSNGNNDYRFYNSHNRWLYEEFPEFFTEPLRLGNYMFFNNRFSTVPMRVYLKGHANSAFENCTNLTDLSNITMTSTEDNQYDCDMNYMFAGCESLVNIPDDFFSSEEAPMTGVGGGRQGMFAFCNSLRSIPSLAAIGTTTPRSNYLGLFIGNYVLDEIKDLFVCDYDPIDSNTFDSCTRLKNLTFETNEDGTPKTAKWSGARVNLTNVGYAFTEAIGEMIVAYGEASGITEGLKIENSADYLYYYNNPNCWAASLEYSRYNHDSAVSTINSLPDTSAYLAENGGANTISFMANACSVSSSRVISSLTAEEIAVAVAKGWTVSLH